MCRASNAGLISANSPGLAAPRDRDPGSGRDHEASQAREGQGPPIALRLDLEFDLATPIIALGGELKNTVCAGSSSVVEISETHGDLSEPDALRGFARTVRYFTTASHHKGGVVAHDLHPSYASTLHARKSDGKLVGVQHHHAHGVSCAVDARMPLPVLAIVCDGAGYGTDGAIWGGELLLCRADGFERLAHLDYFPLPGGDLAAKCPVRPALAVTRDAFGADWASGLFDLGGGSGRGWNENSMIRRQIESGVNTPPTSSLGRLFDAVSYLCGLCDENDREGRAAVALQDAAAQALDVTAGQLEPFAYTIHAARHAPIRLDWRPLIRGVVAEARHGAPATRIAVRFHQTLSRMFAESAEIAAERTGVDRIVLSGGCFLNSILREELARRLRKAGLTVGTHSRVSCGDAGLSLGQAVIGATVGHRMK